MNQITSDLIADLYISKRLSIQAIQKETGLSRYLVSKELRLRGIKIRKGYPTSTKYSINESFFKAIDSPEKAMILGFWYSDGNVHIRKGRGCSCSVSQMASERYYLEHIAKIMGYNAPVKAFTNQHGREYVSLSVYKPSIANDLIALGCYPRKSLTLKFPTPSQVPREFLRDFVRGLFDGDGGFREAIVKGGYRTFGVGFGMSYDMAMGFTEYMKEEGFHFTVHKASKDREKDNRTHAWHVVMGGNHQAVRFCKWLYQDAPFKMERKYSQYLDFLSHYEAYVKNGVAVKRMQEGHRKLYRGASLMSPTGIVYHTNSVSRFCSDTKDVLSLIHAGVFRLLDGEQLIYKGYRLAAQEEVESARSSGALVEKIY
jgi:hypothetical protein